MERGVEERVDKGKGRAIETPVLGEEIAAHPSTSQRPDEASAAYTSTSVQRSVDKKGKGNVDQLASLDESIETAFLVFYPQLRISISNGYAFDSPPSEEKSKVQAEEENSGSE